MYISNPCCTCVYGTEKGKAQEERCFKTNKCKPEGCTTKKMKSYRAQQLGDAGQSGYARKVFSRVVSHVKKGAGNIVGGLINTIFRGKLKFLRPVVKKVIVNKNIIGGLKLLLNIALRKVFKIFGKKKSAQLVSIMNKAVGQALRKNFKGAYKTFVRGAYNVLLPCYMKEARPAVLQLVVYFNTATFKALIKKKKAQRALFRFGQEMLIKWLVAITKGSESFRHISTHWWNCRLASFFDPLKYAVSAKLRATHDDAVGNLMRPMTLVLHRFGTNLSKMAKLELQASNDPVARKVPLSYTWKDLPMWNRNADCTLILKWDYRYCSEWKKGAECDGVMVDRPVAARLLKTTPEGDKHYVNCQSWFTFWDSYTRPLVTWLAGLMSVNTFSKAQVNMEERFGNIELGRYCLSPKDGKPGQFQTKKWAPEGQPLKLLSSYRRRSQLKSPCQFGNVKAYAQDGNPVKLSAEEQREVDKEIKVKDEHIKARALEAKAQSTSVGYVGCFQAALAPNLGSRTIPLDLPHYKGTVNASLNGIEDCRKKCKGDGKGKGFKYFGLGRINVRRRGPSYRTGKGQKGCQCGNEYGKGGQGRRCLCTSHGEPNRNCVYKVLSSRL